MSVNNQFNEGYEQMIETVKSRALWRVGEVTAEGQGFRCRCPKCKVEGPHQRFDVTKHRLLLGRSIRALGAPIPMVRCRHCSQDRHLRDVGELLAPTSIAMHDEIVESARQVIGAGSWSTSSPDVPEAVTSQLPAFRDEASGPVRQHLLTSVATIEATPQMITALPTEPMLRELGRALFLNGEEITAAISAATTGGPSD